MAGTIYFITTRNNGAEKILIQRLSNTINEWRDTNAASTLNTSYGNAMDELLFDSNLSFIPTMFASAGLSEDDLSSPSKLSEAIITSWIEASHLCLIILTYAILRACVRPLLSEILNREIRDPRQRSYENLDKLPRLHKLVLEATEESGLFESGSQVTGSDRYILLAAKVVLANLLNNSSVRPAEETFLGLNKSRGVVPSEVRMLVRDRNYVEEDFR
ncbi:hypothetical protein OCU04_004869 [Sclerotinia nivalis]|uniref:Uncharacterized protein n=1 Tax=Sclerotinia nivalis TaxID=352851 RepID=A0A9X0ARD2_9HELO|nr:hypothetical protein OCU04_004869 [Sclerotinia nivalis]